MSLEGRCPDEFHCLDGSHGFSAVNNLRLVPVISFFISAIVSMMGAILIVFAYCAFKDLRKGTAQTIITLLAFADIGTAGGYLLGILNLLVYNHYHSDTSINMESSACVNFYIICQIQAFIVLGFSVSGYTWTALLAIHFLLATVLSQSSWTERLIPFYNVVAWTLPIIISLPLLLSVKFGYTPTYQTTCFISAYAAEHERSKVILSLEEEIIWGVEAVCAIITIACYVVIFAYIRCKRSRHGLHPSRRVGKRLLAIPIAYLFLRMWDAVQICLGLTTLKEPLACGSHNMQIASFVISIVQVGADTGQGWVNCILYIFLSPELRRRMFVLPLRRFMHRQQPRNFVTSEDAPLINHTENSLSTRGIARKDGDTYFSFPMDMSDEYQNPVLIST